MGLIRVSDYAENLIKEHSHGRTITATVDSILAGSVAPDGTEMWKGQQATDDDDLRDYLDKKFDELKALIEDTTIDRLATRTRGARRDPSLKTYVDWEIMQDILFDFLDEGAPEWVNKSAYEGVHESSDLDTAKFLVQDDCIYIESTYSKAAILNLTPRLKQYLAEKGIVV